MERGGVSVAKWIRGIVIGGALTAAIAMFLSRPRRGRFFAFVNRQFLHQLADWVAGRLRV